MAANEEQAFKGAITLLLLDLVTVLHQVAPDEMEKRLRKHRLVRQQGRFHGSPLLDTETKRRAAEIHLRLLEEGLGRTQPPKSPEPK